MGKLLSVAFYAMAAAACLIAGRTVAELMISHGYTRTAFEDAMLRTRFVAALSAVPVCLFFGYAAGVLSRLSRNVETGRDPDARFRQG